MTLIPVAKCLAMQLSLRDLADLGLSQIGIESRSPACQANVLPTEPPQRSPAAVLIMTKLEPHIHCRLFSNNKIYHFK